MKKRKQARAIEKEILQPLEENIIALHRKITIKIQKSFTRH